MFLPMTYIYLSDLIRMDGPCLKPTDKDKAGRLCGKRAVTGGLTAGSDKAKRAAAKFRAEKYGEKGQSPQQQGINKIPVKPSPGGALVQKGGALAVKEKAAEQSAEQPKNKSRQRKIDEKYAKPNPTDKDVDDWLNESAKEFAKPDEAKLQQETLKTMKTNYGMNENLYWGERAEIAKTIKDRDSFAEAVYAQEQKNKESRGESKGRTTYKPDDFKFFRKAEEDQLKSAERRMSTGKTEASRAKAKKEFERLSKRKEEDQRTAEAAAKRANERDSKPKDQRIQELKDAYDKTFEKAKAEKTDLYERFQKGQKRAVNQVKEDLVSSLPSWGETVQGYGSYESFAAQGVDNVRKEAVKSHLQKAYTNKNNVFGQLGDQPTEGDLKKAYRAAAVKAHPDKGGSKEEFQALNQQYEEMRQKYGFDSLVRGDAFNWAPWEEINRYCDTYIRLF